MPSNFNFQLHLNADFPICCSKIWQTEIMKVEKKILNFLHKPLFCIKIRIFQILYYFRIKKQENKDKILSKSHNSTYVNDYDACEKEKGKLFWYLSQTYRKLVHLLFFSFERRNTITLPVIAQDFSRPIHKCDYLTFHLLSSFHIFDNIFNEILRLFLAEEDEKQKSRVCILFAG